MCRWRGMCWLWWLGGEAFMVRGWGQQRVKLWWILMGGWIIGIRQGGVGGGGRAAAGGGGVVGWGEYDGWRVFGCDLWCVGGAGSDVAGAC
jgi:hypothetical protein